MGLRIRKCLGYSLVDVREKDERINWGSFLLQGEEETPIADYIQYLESLPNGHGAGEKMLTGSMHVPGIVAQDAVVWEPDDGDPRVLLVCPVWCTSFWIRTGDDLDVVENAYRYGVEDTSPKTAVLRRGPHPFTGFMDKVTGERSHPQTWAWARMRDRSVDDEGDQDSLDETRERLSQIIGYRNFRDAVDHVVPEVPEEIQNFTDWGDLFNSPDIWKDLRPALYTYFWG